MMKLQTLQVAVALAVATPAFAQFTLEPYWAIAPVNATTFPDTGNLTRGGAFNPTTGNLLVATRAGGTGVRILSGSTGIEVGTLNMTGVSGGTFALNMIGVGTDGAIYGANLVTAATESAPFKVYRWANELAAPTVIYSGNPGGGRFGDSIAVRGAGATTEIIFGEGTTGARMLHFGTTDGTTFTATPLTVAGMSNGDLRLSLDFGDGNTVYGKQAGPVRWVAYDVAGSSASVTASYTLTSPLGGTVGALGVNGDVLVAYAYSGTAGPQAVNVYSIAGLVAGGNNAPLDSELLPTGNGNSNGVGEIDFNADGSIVYVIAPNNGVLAFRVVPEPGTWAMLGLGSAFLLWAVRRRN